MPNKQGTIATKNECDKDEREDNRYSSPTSLWEIKKKRQITRAKDAHARNVLRSMYIDVIPS